MSANKPDGRHGKQDYEERFWAKAIKSEGCWEWQAAKDKTSGYGWFQLNRTKHSAHRVAWELTNGPIPKGMYVCHHCDNPSCVRPDHLFLGTPNDNIQDMINKGRKRPGGTKGEASPHAKVSSEQVREIRRRYAIGETQISLGCAFGIAGNTVHYIVTGKSWRHIK